MDCSPPGFSVHGILQARILGWVSISFFRGSSQPRDQICVCCIAGRFFTTEPLGKPTVGVFNNSKCCTWGKCIYSSQCVFRHSYCWRRLLRVPWTARSNQSILKEINPEFSLERLMLKLKLQYFGHLMRRTDSLEKTDAGKNRRQQEKGMTEDEMVGWHHWLNGHKFEQAPGDGEGKRSLVYCSSKGCKELNMNERLNNNSNCSLWMGASWDP